MSGMALQYGCLQYFQFFFYRIYKPTCCCKKYFEKISTLSKTLNINIKQSTVI